MPIRLRAIDRRFARFCRTGDARSLGAVFDGTAAELLHLAGWLAGNRADAEDLLQQTFLTAIEHRAAFDTERRVLPWLVSILTNHARNLRRERLRRAALPGRPEPVADPVATAAQAEFGAWLAAARAGLGPPYREVLALHLDEGLDAEEIAVRLRRPPGTVRTQIVRGLERLRRRVPTGFVAAAAPCVPADVVVATLTKVRATVTAAARLQSPAAAAGSSATAGAAIVMPMAGGVLVGKAAALASVLVLVAGVAGAVLWGRPGAAVHPTDGARHAAEPRSAPATLAAGATDASPPAPPARREIVPAPSAQGRHRAREVHGSLRRRRGSHSAGRGRDRVRADRASRGPCGSGRAAR